MIPILVYTVISILIYMNIVRRENKNKNLDIADYFIGIFSSFLWLPLIVFILIGTILDYFVNRHTHT